jgi:hypothetical protein
VIRPIAMARPGQGLEQDPWEGLTARKIFTAVSLHHRRLRTRRARWVPSQTADRQDRPFANDLGSAKMQLRAFYYCLNQDLCDVY